jgi:dTMP kinase
MASMKRTILPGFFVLEGLDGSGTSTQMEHLKGACPGTDYSFSAEPTPHPVGKLIREVLKSRISLSSLGLAHLFCADRDEHINGQNGVKALINNGKKVINDRYILSSLAYQSLASDYDLIYSLNGGFELPEMTFFLDIDPDKAFARISSRSDEREIFEQAETLKKVRANYFRGIADLNNEGATIHILDGSRSIEEIHRQLCGFLGIQPIIG